MVDKVVVVVGLVTSKHIMAMMMMMMMMIVKDRHCALVVLISLRLCSAHIYHRHRRSKQF